jgi:hypothetical protein
MEDKIVNNLIYGHPFFFPIWKAPIDENKTLQASFEDGTMSSLPGFQRLNEDQMEQAVRNAKYLFAVYTAGDKSHPKWNESKNVVRAFPNSYREATGIKTSLKSWLPKLV